MSRVAWCRSGENVEENMCVDSLGSGCSCFGIAMLLGSRLLVKQLFLAGIARIESQNVQPESAQYSATKYEVQSGIPIKMFSCPLHLRDKHPTKAPRERHTVSFFRGC